MSGRVLVACRACGGTGQARPWGECARCGGYKVEPEETTPKPDPGTAIMIEHLQRLGYTVVTP